MSCPNTCNPCKKANKAAKRGHLECLQSIVSKTDFTWDSKHQKEAAILASRYGHLDCLQYAHQNGCYLHDLCQLIVDGQLLEKTAVNVAILGGHIDCLRYAHQEAEVELTEEAFIIAAIKGHLNCIEYLHQQGHAWYHGTVALCARYGHLDCLRFACENGAPYSNDTFDITDDTGNGEIVNCSPETIAAVYGHMDCLKYLREKDPIRNVETIEFAMLYKKLECAEYLIEQGFPCIVRDFWIEQGRLDPEHLDEPFWRDFLLNKAILRDAPSVQRLVDQKKAEIEKTKEACMYLVSENKIVEDIVKYVLHVYI
jgi:hypothetical protein